MFCYFNILNYYQVRQWLEEVYGGEKVPQYEVNDQTINILYELMLLNRMRDKHGYSEIEDLKQKILEYNAEGCFSYLNFNLHNVFAIILMSGVPVAY